MNCRKFNSYMPEANEKWVAEALKMRQNPDNGIDLIGERADIEVKFTLLHPEGIYPVGWTVQEHQLAYANQKSAYWALGTYRLVIPVSAVKTKEIAKLENLVTERELWIVPWNWIEIYKPSTVRGETKNSKWENTFRYTNIRDLPRVIESMPAKKGIIHLTKGVKKREII